MIKMESTYLIPIIVILTAIKRRTNKRGIHVENSTGAIVNNNTASE